MSHLGVLFTEVSSIQRSRLERFHCIHVSSQDPPPSTLCSGASSQSLMPLNDLTASGAPLPPAGRVEGRFVVDDGEGRRAPGTFSVISLHT